MRNLTRISAAVGLALLSTTSLNAATLTFEGSVTAIGVVTPSTACAPRRSGTIDPSTSSGFSNLGSFTYAHQVCTGRGGPINGDFEIDFGDDGFFGTLSGVTAQNADDPTFFDFNIDYTIVGGTGRFLGATGSFLTGMGSGANTSFQPSRITLNFVDGTIDAPAVPEPGTWALLIVGFGMMGAAMRRRRPIPAFA